MATDLICFVSSLSPDNSVKLGSMIEKKQKIIGVGFHKTGTTTLGDCLKILGYNHLSADRKSFIDYQNNKMEKILKKMEKFDSFEYWPWPLIYQEAYYKFPGSKFILTYRINEEVWYNSLEKHVERGAGKGFHYRKFIYGYDNPSDNKEAHIKKYIEHNAAVRNFFKDKPNKLLEICWEKGDSWDKLCSFLNEEIPDQPLPHSNPQSIKTRIPISKRILEFYYSIKKF